MILLYVIKLFNINNCIYRILIIIRIIYFDYSLHINHVLREFKTHLSWFGTSISKSLSVSVRYFYIPRMEYGESDYISNNIICGSPDPLQLEQKQNNTLINNLLFYEWQISNNNSAICPPSASCILIVVSMSTPKKLKQKCKQNQNRKRDNELNDSDTDNGMNIPDDEENTNSEESNICYLLTFNHI